MDQREKVYEIEMLDIAQDYFLQRLSIDARLAMRVMREGVSEYCSCMGVHKLEPKEFTILRLRVHACKI